MNRRLRRIVSRFSAVLCVALLSVFGIPSVAAHGTPPTRTTEPPFDFASSTAFCGFPLSAHTLRDNIKITTFSDGRQLVTGGRTVRVTNLGTAKSIVLRDTGSVTTNAEQTSEVLTGSIVLSCFRASRSVPARGSSTDEQRLPSPNLVGSSIPVLCSTETALICAPHFGARRSSRTCAGWSSATVTTFTASVQRLLDRDQGDEY